MTLAVGQESMDTELMIDLAECSISKVFPQVIPDTEPVLIIEGKLDRSLPFFLFFIEFGDPFCKVSDRVIVLFFQFIQPSE